MTDGGPPRYRRAGVVDNPELVVDDGETIIVEHPDREEYWVCRRDE